MTITAHKIQVGTLSACLNRAIEISLPPEMPMWKRIIPALELLFRGRVTIPGPRL